MSILRIASNWIAGQKFVKPQPFEVTNRRACMLGACAIRARGFYTNPCDLNLFLEAIQKHAAGASTSMESVVQAEQFLQNEVPARILEISAPIFDTFAKAVQAEVSSEPKTLIPGESDPPDEFESDSEHPTYKSMVAAMRSANSTAKPSKSRRNRKRSKPEDQ
jgi:hypothetical protein